LLFIILSQNFSYDSVVIYSDYNSYVQPKLLAEPKIMSLP